jgi:hypothetical protein
MKPASFCEMLFWCHTSRAAKFVLKIFNFLNRSGHYIYTTRSNIQQFYVLPTPFIYVFCLDLRTNRDYFPIQHELAGFYNGDGVCLLRGTDWIFIYRQFNIQQFYVLPTQSIYVFCVDLRTNSDYFPIINN